MLVFYDNGVGYIGKASYWRICRSSSCPRSARAGSQESGLCLVSKSSRFIWSTLIVLSLLLGLLLFSPSAISGPRSTGLIWSSNGPEWVYQCLREWGFCWRKCGIFGWLLGWFSQKLPFAVWLFWQYQQNMLKTQPYSWPSSVFVFFLPFPQSKPLKSCRQLPPRSPVPLDPPILI